DRCDQPARLSGRAGRHPDDRHAGHRGEPRRRSVVRRVESAYSPYEVRMNNPHAHMSSLPPEGVHASLEAARREAWMNYPHAHIRSLSPKGTSFGAPPEGAHASLEAARREA